jgi:3-oxoadipate enol-lactonase
MSLLKLHQTLQLNYRVDGDGPMTWLLFNGATLPLQFWDPVAQGLATEHKIVRLDQRNAGATRASGAFSLLEVSADAAALLDHLKIERAIVAGHAWGGRVAQVFARDYPHRLTGLVICGTGGQFPATVSLVLWQQWRDAARARDRERWEQVLAAAYCAKGFSKRDPDAFRSISDLLWSQIEGRVERRRATWDRHIAPSSSYWGSARVPTLLIYGTEDGNGTRQNAEDLASRIPGARLHFINQAGHFVIREQPGQVLALMRAFANCLAETQPA